MGLKSDTLLKHWMEREKVAVDYARTCDKRIAELQADVARLQNTPRQGGGAEPSKVLLERQLEAAKAFVRNLTGEIEQLRAQLAQAEALSRVPVQKTNLNSGRLAKLEALADAARAGLAEELRIQKKPEPTLEEAILISDEEDLIPARWLPLKKALQALHVMPLQEAQKARH